MEKEQLEIKRYELRIYIDNFYLSSEAVLRKVRKFEDLANNIYEIKDRAYWMKRSKELEDLLKEVSALCPAGYKYEIERVLGTLR